MNQKALRTRQVTELAIFLALAVVLEFLSFLFPRMPFGGSFSISMLPLFVLTLRHGFKIGFLAGALYGILDMLISGLGYITVHWAVFFLDYLFAFGAVGFAGFIFMLNKKNPFIFALGISVAMLIRLFFHWLSGVTIWSTYVAMDYPDVSVAVGSLIYNSLYMIPSLIVTAILGFVLHITLQDQLLEENLSI
ncbi:MAG: energy-coupled thiamine transporter ThiT [Bacillota bacterium]